MLLTKKFRFEAGHNLVNYKGDCEKLHGHSYVLEVTVGGEIKENGFVIDFREVEKIAKEKVVNKLDHSYLNDVIPISTCENISRWIWDNLKNDLDLKEIRLYETVDSWVTYSGE